MQAWGILACLMLTAVRARSHYVVLIPAELRTDTLENVCVLILSTTESSPLTLTIENEVTNSTLLQQELLTNTGYNCFTFTIECKELDSDCSTLIAVTVRGSGGNISINETKRVVLKRYDSLTFIQTDKAVYKPGQTVKFRIVTLNENFFPIQEKYPLVTVWDPDRNRIGQWRDVEPRQGIADLTFDLMPEPMKGTYRIEVLKNKGKRDHDFSVQEYVLPKAELKVKLPQKIKITDPTIHIEVCGSYTYGRPVRGMVNGTVCLPTHRGQASKYCQQVVGKTDSNGCLSEDLSIKPFRLNRRLYNRGLRASFVLMEEGTGQYRQRSASCNGRATLPACPSPESQHKCSIPSSAMESDHKGKRKPYKDTESLPKCISIQAFGSSEIVSEITKITFEEVAGYFRKDLQYNGQIRMQYSTGGPVSNATIYLFNSMVPGAEKVSTDENGIASFSLDTSSWGSQPVSFTAIYQGQYQDYRYRNTLPHHQSAHHLVKPFYSRSNSYLSIRKHRHDLACDSELDLNVDYIIKALSAQEKHDLDVFYLVMSRGLIMTFEKKTISVGGSEGIKGHLHLSIPINADLSPVARLLVFAVLPDGETIGDSSKFRVSKCFRNKVSLHFSVAEDLPKSHVSLDVHAAPDSLCGLRVVDRSVLLLKPEKELSRDSVYSLLPVRDLSGYNYRVHENALEFCRRQNPWSEPVSMGNAIGDFETLIQDLGLKILTNTEYHRPIECEISTEMMYEYSGMGLALAYDSPAAPGEYFRVSAPHISTLPGPSPGTEIRKYFPETWIWDLVSVGSTGSVSLPLTVPDSITEWKGSMFCTGQAGFGISEAVSLNAFKPFFAELALPYSIVRTEEFTLKAKIFNYLKKCIMVKVTLLEHKGFGMASESNIEHQTCVCSMDSVTISWHLNATGLGEQNLTVKAESISTDSLCGNEVAIVPEKGAIDVIRKPLLIKPEGTETELTHSSLLCPAGKSVTEKIHLQLPEDVVEGSSRAYITVLGDIMGSAMENLDGLLRLPMGCGEQNMVKFAPNVYVQRYLNKTQQLTGEIQDRAVGYLRKGYQNQLKYKHSDGSFSAFGGSDPEGNTWLTAFVLKSFLQARPYIFIDEQIYHKATTFFLEHRMESGCFASLGSLFNNAMKGGVDDHISLSAYVTSALLELEKNDKELANNIYHHFKPMPIPDSVDASASTALPLHIEIDNFTTGVTNRALSCLRDALETVNSTYTLSLLAYTFTLAEDQVTRSKILNRLEGLAVKKDGLTHWQRKEDPEEEEDHGYWWRAPSAEVEMTAYVLLALLSQPQVPASDLDQATHIVSWLVKQRNSYGGFASTQDTVVALQALALYAELTHVADPHSSVSVTSLNVFHLQTTLRYNTPTAQKDSVFNLSVDMVLEDSKNKMNINVTYIGDRPVSNMVLVDVSMLSGFSADKESYKQSLDYLNISRAEVHEEHTVLYLKPMEPNHLLQLSILVHQDFEVKNLKAAVLKVYDYYETDDSVEVEYEAPRGSENV
ncbi:pregnancy zone protein-like [Scyliorhinus canicula]|uniref:pregnancy zone protein-like n=1 Tax=Scyliorhinus canicula TaxID=7830 RepID=UPI0018F578F7|nr:pregnancy zone protein-like [Scyliorhinus canicula]